MGDLKIDVFFLSPAKEYLNTLPVSDQSLIAAHVTELASGNFQLVRTKQLKGPVRELIANHHRLIYFAVEGRLYLVRGFRKKSRKTPKSEIEYAEKIYKMVIQKK